MKIFVYLTALLLAFRIVNAEGKQDHPKTTSFYMISTERDFIGQGKAYAYLEGENTQFQVQRSGRGGESSYPEVVEMSVGEKNSWQHWRLAFTSPEHQVLQPGVYKMAERYPFNDNMPGLSISGHGRGCNTLIGEFEILEVKRLESEEIVSFAANFIQRCEKRMPPLFGSIRYNSTIPVEARFDEYFSKTADFTVYLTKHNPMTGEKSQPILISKDADSNCELRKLAYGGEGIEISMSDNDDSTWILAFAAPLDEQFSTGTYENAARYPFHSPSVPGIEITTPDGSFSQPQGAFKVLKLVRGGDGEIQSLALNFQVKNSQGEILEGAVRFKSKVPVNLDKPFN